MKEKTRAPAALAVLAALLLTSCAGLGRSARGGDPTCADLNVVCRCEVLCVPCGTGDHFEGPVDAYVADVRACCESEGVQCPPCPACR